MWVIKALQIKSTLHPQHYKISWVNKGVEIQVTKMCKVTFSIGKSYQCEVLCDIIDMDDYHVILDRSWQFDEGIWYDGRANAYVVKWKGKKLRLLSNDTNPTQLKQDKTAFLAITEAEIWKEF